MTHGVERKAVNGGSEDVESVAVVVDGGVVRGGDGLLHDSVVGGLGGRGSSDGLGPEPRGKPHGGERRREEGNGRSIKCCNSG